MAEQYTSVGKLGKPHGISGAFRFLLQRELKSKQKFPKHFLLGTNGSAVPWFVRNIEWIGFNEGFISFEEVTTPERAKQFSGSELFVSEKDVKAYFKKDAETLGYLKNYTAIDETAGEIGVIAEIIENPGQNLLSFKGKDILIPYVEDFIVEVNKRKKQIILNLPEGLLDL